MTKVYICETSSIRPAEVDDLYKLHTSTSKMYITTSWHHVKTTDRLLYLSRSASRYTNQCCKRYATHCGIRMLPSYYG